MAAPPIDPREWTATVALLKQYELQQRPDVAVLLAMTDPRRPTPGNVARWRDLREIASAAAAFHEQHPLLVAPPGTLDTGTFSLDARQVADGQAITLPGSRVAQHLGIFGRSGEGKTTIAQRLAISAYERNLSVITIDAKHDAQHLAVAYPQTILITARTPVPLLERPSWLTEHEARALLVRAVRRVWWGGEGLDQVAHASLRLTAERTDRPSVRDWQRETLALHAKGETYNQRDRIDGLASRLARLSDAYPGIGATPAGSGISLDDLCTRPVYFGYTIQTAAEELIATWLIELRFSYNRTHGIRNLNTLALLDESLLLFHEDTISGSASLGSTFPLLREFGIAAVVTANHYRSLPASVRANLGTHVVMNLSDAGDGRELGQTLGLSREQQEWVNGHLTLGQCVIKLPIWHHAVLATFDPLTVEKTVSAGVWEDAEARTLRLARPESTAAAREGVTRQQPALPASPRLVPAAEESPSIALNTNEETLLRFIGEHRVVLTTECDLHPQLLTRAKKKLLSLGLIAEEKITARAGRGGQANALGLSASGAAWLRLTPGGAGGGHLQHQFLVRKLLERIAGAQREVSLGGKRVDVLFTYTTEHAWIASIAGIALNSGDPVAIEVEVSDPTKTAPVNLTKNHAAGVALTIIAVLPNEVERSRASLRDATVVNVFDLLRGAA
jgi:hypothetical protein